jgi:hypothetical protein
MEIGDIHLFPNYKLDAENEGKNKRRHQKLISSLVVIEWLVIEFAKKS